MLTPRLVTLFVGLGVSAACSSDSSGPDAEGPPFFTATVDGATWRPQYAQAYCAGSDVFLVAQRTFGHPETTAVLNVQVRDIAHLGRVVLSDSGSGRFGLFVEFPLGGQNNGVPYHTRLQAPGHLTLSGLNREDSLLAGSFAFAAAADDNPTIARTIVGSFRAVLAPVYTVDEPDGSLCTVPPF